MGEVLLHCSCCCYCRSCNFSLGPASGPVMSHVGNEDGGNLPRQLTRLVLPAASYSACARWGSLCSSGRADHIATVRREPEQVHLGTSSLLPHASKDPVHHLLQGWPCCCCQRHKGSASDTVCCSCVLRAQHSHQLHIWHYLCGCLGALLFCERGAGGHILALGLTCDRSAENQDQQTSSTCKQCLSCGWRQ